MTRTLEGAGIRPFALRLTRPLETAHGRIEERRGWLVWLRDPAGIVAVGEATPLVSFGSELPEVCEQALLEGLQTLLADPGAPLEESLERLSVLRDRAPCALAALDGALHDLEARRASLSLADWIRRRAGRAGPAARSVAVQALVAGATPEAVAEAVTRARRAGYRTLKLKLAVSPARRAVDVDLMRVAALRAAAGPAMRLRLDANEAWSRDEAASALERLARFEIDFVEQPVARGDLEGLARLAARAPIAVAADEALIDPGPDACLARRAAGVFVLKPAVLGGIAPAMRCAEGAAALGIRVVWSTLLDGAVSRAGVWQLAAALGATDEAHGLATGEWIARDLLGTPPVHGGCLAGSTPALGLGIDGAKLLRAEGPPWIGPARETGEIR